MQIRLAACAALITALLAWPASAQQPANPEGGAHPLEDLVAADLTYRKAVEKGIGQEVRV